MPIVVAVEANTTFEGLVPNISTNLIASAADLHTIVRADRSGNYIQTADIDLSGYANWEPIGVDWVDYFSGTYDGNGYKISNLTQDLTGTAYELEWGNTGVFGICAGATIRNLGLVNVSVYSPSGEVGALAGYVSGSLIEGCYVIGGTVQSASTHVGGLIGYIYGGDLPEDSQYVTNCFAMVEVIGSNYTGGLIGEIFSNEKYVEIKNCFASGAVSGGVVIGGLIGKNDTTPIVNCYYNEDISGQSDIGKGDPKTTAEMKSIDTYNPEWDMTTDNININNGYPYLEFVWGLADWKIYEASVVSEPPTLNHTSITMEEGSVIAITASEESVAWSTSNASVAYIEVDINTISTVFVFAVAEGSAVVTASNENGTASCDIIVEQKEISVFETIEVCAPNFSVLSTLNNDEIIQCRINKELSGDYSIEVILPINAQGVSFFRRGRYLHCEGQYFTIERLVPSRSRDDLPVITITAVHIMFETAHWVIHPNQELFLRGNIISHLNAALAQSNFNVVGINSTHAFYNVERAIDYPENTKILDAIKLIFNTFGGNFIIDGFSIKVIPFGAMPSSEVSLAYTINNSSIKRTLSDTNTITKLYATGGEGTEGEPLKRYLPAEQHLQNIYRRDRVEFIDMSDVRVWNNFVFLTDQYMERRKYPAVSYDLSVAELKHLSLPNFTFDIGQTIRVFDAELGIDEEKPIKKYTYRPLEPDHLSTVVVGDRAPDITFKEQRFEGQVGKTEGEWRYDEIAERWIFFPHDPWDSDDDDEDQWGKEYTLWIDKVGGQGTLTYRYLPHKDAPEKIKVSVQKIPTKAGTILLYVDNKAYSVPVMAGESRTSIATKIEALTIPGWLTTKNGWDIIMEAAIAISEEALATTDYLVYTFSNVPVREDSVTISGNTANYEIDYDEGTVTFNASQEELTILADYEYDIIGSRTYSADIDPQNTGAELSLIISEGTTSGVLTPWIASAYTLKRKFSYGDEVYVLPLDGDSLFLEWAGEGIGALERKFVMTENLDATAIYSEDSKTKPKDHTLSISKVGGDGTLDYRYYPSHDSQETFSIRLYSPALEAGTIILSIDNVNYNIPVAYGESMVSIATKIDELEVLGWESERDGWVVNYTATAIGSKPYPATYDHNETKAEARISVETGTTANQWTPWILDSYNLSKRFSTDDLVEVTPLDGVFPFVEWIGEGTGSPVRSFTMVEDLDATAIYGEDHGQDYTLLVSKYGGDDYEIPSSLEWRVKAAQNRQEEVKISINSGAIESGSVVITIDSTPITLYINEGESAISIAAKFEGISFNGYTTERSDWTVTYTADIAGAKGGYFLEVAWLSTAEEKDGFKGIVDVRDSIKRGTTAGEYTVWTNAKYPFRSGFSIGDIVQVEPLNGKYTSFMRWTGEGSGSPTRSFTMDQSLDATAIYEGERAGKEGTLGTYTLVIDKHPGLPASLAYRSMFEIDRAEVSTLTISKSAKSAGIFGIRIGGGTYAVAVSEYESRVSIASALASLSYLGWDVELTGWTIKFTATSDGSQIEPASVLPSDSMAEGSFSTIRGSIAHEWTSWTPAEFNFSRSFDEGAQVEVIAEAGDSYTQFDRWTGEGSGSPTRSFTMDQSLDATAQFSCISTMEVITWDDVEIDATTIRLNAEVTKLGRYESVQRGFVWGFSNNPTIDKSEEGVLLNAEGIINAGSGGVGFFDGDLNKHSGSKETAILTIASGASASGHLTITTLAGSVNVDVIAGDSFIQVAGKVNSAVFSGWSTEVSAHQVTFTADTEGPIAHTISVNAHSTGVDCGFAIVKGSLPPADETIYYYRPYITVNDKFLGVDTTEYGDQGTVQFIHGDGYAVRIDTKAKQSGIEILPYVGTQYHADQTILQLEAVIPAEVGLPFDHWGIFTGRAEKSILTVTGGATSTGNCTITLCDQYGAQSYTTILIGAGSPPATVAQKIADISHPDWDIKRSGTQVIYEDTRFKENSPPVTFNPGTTGIVTSMNTVAGKNGVVVDTIEENPHDFTVTQDINIRAVFLGELGDINVTIVNGVSLVGVWYQTWSGAWVLQQQAYMNSCEYSGRYETLKITPQYFTKWLLRPVSAQHCEIIDGNIIKTKTDNVTWSGGGEDGLPYITPTRYIEMSGSEVNVTITFSKDVEGLKGFISKDDPDPAKGKENYLWFKYKEE